MDLVPEHHPSSSPEGEVGSTGPTPPSQPQLPNAADNPPNQPQCPQTNPNITEESTSSNALSAAPEQPTRSLMGPGQPGTQFLSPPLPPSPPEEEFDPFPSIGPHASISSSSACNLFAPHHAPNNADVQIIQGLLPADRLLIWQRLEDLRESTNGILTGVANFYNQGNLTTSRDREGQPPICDEATLNTAFRIILNALDAGFPPESAPHKGGQGFRCLTRRRGGGVNQKSLKKSTNFDARGRPAKPEGGGVITQRVLRRKKD